MKRVLGITFAVLAMAAIAFGADNTLGTWKYNTAKSKRPAGVSPVTNLTVMRGAVGDGVKITSKGERADGSKLDTVTTTKYDGKEVAVTPRASRGTPPLSSRSTPTRLPRSAR